MTYALDIATAFFHADGKAPNARISGDEKKFTLYYVCMAVFFWSARRALPEATLTLFTDRELPEKVKNLLISSGASITIVPKAEYALDQSFYNTFPGCLFSLDVINHLANEYTDMNSFVMLLDSDCIFLRHPRKLLNFLEGQLCISALEMDYPLNHMLNGHTRASLSLAAQKLYGSSASIPIKYYGGEFYGLRAELIKPLAARVRMIWSWLKCDEQKKWLGRQITEEHVLSLALSDPELQVLPANSAIKRIWTADGYSNVDGHEAELDIWHLPAEKRRGFPRLYRKLTSNLSDNELDDNAFLNLVLSEMNLSPSGRLKLLRVLKTRIRSSVKALLAPMA